MSQLQQYDLHALLYVLRQTMRMRRKAVSRQLTALLLRFYQNYLMAYILSYVIGN